MKAKLGRSELLNPRNKRLCAKIICEQKVKKPKLVTRQLISELGIEVSTNTIRHALVAVGMAAVKKKKKPALSRKNKKLRLKFAEVRRDWTVDDWRRVIFSDESKMNRLVSDGAGPDYQEYLMQIL